MPNLFGLPSEDVDAIMSIAMHQNAVLMQDAGLFIMALSTDGVEGPNGEGPAVQLNAHGNIHPKLLLRVLRDYVAQLEQQQKESEQAAQAAFDAGFAEGRTAGGLVG